jgi:hypothetical protein
MSHLTISSAPLDEACKLPNFAILDRGEVARTAATSLPVSGAVYATVNRSPKLTLLVLSSTRVTRKSNSRFMSHTVFWTLPESLPDCDTKTLNQSRQGISALPDMFDFLGSC